MRYVTALSIAGSDCSGGAGIQADIKTMSALGVYAASVITAITVQNTCGVKAVEAVCHDVVAAQIHAVMTDIRPKAIKIGMINDAATAVAITDALSEYAPIHLVIDPVMASTGGTSLMSGDAMEVLTNKLMPMAAIVTPNIPEAEILAGMGITDSVSCDSAGKILSERYGGYVLIKGGHAVWDGGKCDRLYKNGIHLFDLEGETVATPNTHGTGCTLSAAITSFLARGIDMEQAVKKAKEYVGEAIKAGAEINIGHGHGPLNHLFAPEKLVVEDERNVIAIENFR